MASALTCRSLAAAAEVEPPPPNTARSMPAQKCLPVDEITMQRARALSLMSRTITGSSFQSRGSLIASGRLSWMCATSSMVTERSQSRVVT